MTYHGIKVINYEHRIRFPIYQQLMVIDIVKPQVLLNYVSGYKSLTTERSNIQSL